MGMRFMCATAPPCHRTNRCAGIVHSLLSTYRVDALLRIGQHRANPAWTPTGSQAALQYRDHGSVTLVTRNRSKPAFVLRQGSNHRSISRILDHSYLGARLVHSVAANIVF